jgi:transcriptional regulator with GAF, ATPase, and Fis domain
MSPPASESGDLSGLPSGDDEVPAGDLKSVERARIERALENARFNKSKAAKELGLSRHQLYIRMRRLGLDA